MMSPDLLVSINNFRIDFDNFFRYVPVISTLTGLTDIAQKALYRNEPCDGVSYTHHIQRLSYSDLAIQLLPVVGNAILIAKDILFPYVITHVGIRLPTF